MASDHSPLYSAAEAAEILGTSAAGLPGARILGVVVDSRQVEPGSLFVALPGERVDGHEYIGAALQAGASCVLARADRRAAIESVHGIAAASRGVALLFVPDTLAALQALARDHRKRFPKLLRIGITGSSGKTTTKECAAAVLGLDRSLVLNPGNLNSDVGLSLAMFGIGAEHEIGVFEMGMNRRGEMAELARIFEPDIALVTNIGTAHIGILGSRDQIAQEKKMIFSHFDGGQIGLVPEDDDFNGFLKEGVRGGVADFGIRSTKGFRGAEDLGLDGYTVDWEGHRFHFPLIGKHNLRNAIAAMAIAERVGTPPRVVAEGLSSVRPLFGRSEILRGELTIIRDCYNANPDSVQAAIELCDSVAWKERRAYVLGSMLELGHESELEHRRVGAAAASSKADALFFFGEEARPAFEEARRGGFRGLLVFETDFDRLREAAKAYLRQGDLVLLKASRSMALERLADALDGGARNREGGAGEAH